jgi:hypothetical protein
MQPLVGVAIQYVLARSAWTIFVSCIYFLRQGLKQRLWIYVGEGEESITYVLGDRCRQLLSSGSDGHRSCIPRLAPKEFYT